MTLSVIAIVGVVGAALGIGTYGVRRAPTTEDRVGGGGARDPWNRSMRDTPYRPGHHRSDPVERLFVATAIVSLVGFAVWFAFFAGAPFPNSPGP